MGMQQLALFKPENKKFCRGNLRFEIIEENLSYNLGLLDIPSGKFIVKYSLIWNKIDFFEVVDYSGYLYVTISLIKNIKNLVQVILNNWWCN